MAGLKKIYAAIDTPDLAVAKRLCYELHDEGLGLKLGLEFFMRHGPQGVQAALPSGASLFLDLKLHDIPNTVAGAVASVCNALAPDLLTIHTLGGAAMMRAAAQAVSVAGAKTRLLGVTVLTSLDQADLMATGQNSTVADQVQRLAQLAKEAGLAGSICAPHEAAALRAALGPDFLLVTPGVRPEGSDIGDQKRVMTPQQAMAQGASALVIGRPITGAENPAAAAHAILKGLP